MHWRTFERLQATHDAYVNQVLAGMSAKLGLAIGRLEGYSNALKAPPKSIIVDCTVLHYVYN